MQTNGERNNVWSICSILKSKYVKDLTVDLSEKKMTENNQWKDGVITKYLKLTVTLVHNTQPTTTNRHQKTLTPRPPRLPASSGLNSNGECNRRIFCDGAWPTKHGDDFFSHETDTYFLFH